MSTTASSAMRPTVPELGRLVLLAAWAASPAAGEPSILERATVPLPGPPATVVPADVDGDGRLDLAVVAAYTTWREVGIEERAELDDVDGWVEVLTVVPTLFDRRELILFLDDGAGGYRAAGPPLDLGEAVHALIAGPPGDPVLALTDRGVASLRLHEVDGGAPAVRLETVVETRTALEGSGAFVSDLDLLHDLDGDGLPDLLVPTLDGFEIYRGAEKGLDPVRAGTVATAGEPPGPRAPALVQHLPMPRVGDLDGDGVADLLLPSARFLWDHPRVLRGRGGFAFGPPIEPIAPPPARPDAPEVVFVGDLDGDGRAEVVGRTSKEDPDAGLRKELRAAKRPPATYHFYRTDAASRAEPSAYRRLDAAGYAFDNGGAGDERAGPSLPAGFQDLDGDGDLDLVTLTLDFSVFQAVRVLATRSIDIGIDFHVWCQAGDGRFEAVDGLDLSGRFKLRLDDARLGRLAQFAGDFDGDGRADFVQLGRGEKVTVHRGRDGCRYPAAPDLVIDLGEPLRDLALVRIRDFDGDGRADLAVTRPGDGAAPLRFDVYRSARP